MPQIHSRPTPTGRAYWHTERLWALAARLPVEAVAVADIAELDEDCRFGGRPATATCRAVAVHARRIYDADLSYPIILAADGRLMDGGHRAAKAWLLGHPHLPAVRFPTTPPPDRTSPQG